ncbi:MAG TPA: hypothetical protein VEB42_02150, partial [Chitinophagaceae bacterium]|nr:hypothetical protein [Chitinophagaceae bacterium]
IRVLLKQRLKICFPKKVDELRKGLLRLLAVVPVLKMIPMKKLYMLHTLKVRIAPFHTSLLSFNNE